MSNAMHPKTKTFLRECILEIEKDDGSAEMASHLLYWSDDDDYYVLSTPSYERKDLETLSERAMLIPKIFYLAVIPNDLTIAPIPPPSDSFLKVVDPLVFVPEINSEKHPTDGADIIVQEARVYERYLLKHPHPHICECYGYVPTGDGRLKGLCIKRHKKDLREAVKVGELLDVDKIVEGIRSGLTHLHSLGLVHGDINPANIVIDDDGRAVIIDFGSCEPTGSELMRAMGTYPWTNNAKIVAEENDFHGLNKIEAWLRGEQAKKDASAIEP